MATIIAGALQSHRALLPQQARQAIDDSQTVRVQYVRNASKWGVFAKVGAVIAFPVAIVAAMRGSYTRRLMLASNQVPAPIDTGVNRCDWKKVLRASRDPARVDQLDGARQAQLRSIAIKLIGVSGQDQGLKAVWRSPDTSTADLVQLAVHCVGDTTGEFRTSVFNALRAGVTESHQRERSLAFEQMRADFKADEASLRAQIGEVKKLDAKAGGLEIEFQLTGDQIRALDTFKVKTQHFDQIRPLIAEMTRMPQGTPEERAAWLNKTLTEHRDGARLLALIPDLLSDKALAEMGQLKDLLDKDRPFIEAMRQALDIKGLDAKGKAALHSEPVQSEKKGFFAKAGALLKTANKAAQAINLKAEVEQKIKKPVDGAHAEAFAKAIDQAVEAYDFSVYTSALANMTGDLPPELGRFLGDVLQRYFSSQNLGDKKTMLASLYQQGNTAEPLDHMVALLKGAGPFLQKIVQQLGSQAKDPAVATALQALKENLNPIADEERLVLLSAVARSIGAQGSKMTNIRVLSSASVAETLAVTLEPPEGQGGAPREVVVKLLRPGIVERAGRERAFFERVAAERGGQAAGGGDGLVRTMASIADQIESELDLRVEAAEIQKAQVYAGRPEAADGRVQVMTMTAGQEARAEFLILDKMPGRSVKGFVAEMEAAARNPETTPAQLATLKAQGEALCQRLITLNTMWLKEAFYGSGFYHGDLHAGNLMVDTPEGGPTTLGVIDFGNAATLDPKVQRDFLRIQAAAEQYHPNRTIDALRGLLPPDARPRLDALRPMLLLELKGLMVKDRENALNCDLVGEFLSVATQLGIEIPGAMLQFGRSQGMLRDTFERAQKALTEVSRRAGDASASIAKDALDDATLEAITGNRRALIGKAGLGFGMAIRNRGDAQAMFDEFQGRPESSALIAKRNKEREDYDDMASELSRANQQMVIERSTLGLLVKDKAEVWDADDATWQAWVADLPVAIRVPDEQLERFREMCRNPDSVSDIAEWGSFSPLAAVVDPDNERIIASLLEHKQRADFLSATLPPSMPPELKPADVVDVVLKAERDKFKAQAQAGAAQALAGRAEGAPALPQDEDAGEQVIPAGQSAALQAAVAQRLSNHILGEGAGVGQAQPA